MQCQYSNLKHTLRVYSVYLQSHPPLLQALWMCIICPLQCKPFSSSHVKNLSMMMHGTNFSAETEDFCFRGQGSKKNWKLNVGPFWHTILRTPAPLTQQLAQLSQSAAWKTQVTNHGFLSLKSKMLWGSPGNNWAHQTNMKTQCISGLLLTCQQETDLTQLSQFSKSGVLKGKTDEE